MDVRVQQHHSHWLLADAQACVNDGNVATSFLLPETPLGQVESPHAQGRGMSPVLGRIQHRTNPLYSMCPQVHWGRCAAIGPWRNLQLPHAGLRMAQDLLVSAAKRSITEGSVPGGRCAGRAVSLWGCCPLPPALTPASAWSPAGEMLELSRAPRCQGTPPLGHQ